MLSHISGLFTNEVKCTSVCKPAFNAVLIEVHWWATYITLIKHGTSILRIYHISLKLFSKLPKIQQMELLQIKTNHTT